MSDLHGCYEKYKQMLEAIHFNVNDTLYILGDVIDRGHKGIDIIMEMMKTPNIVPILGNHEYMAYRSLSKLNVEITAENYDKQLDLTTTRGWQLWIANGGYPTHVGFTYLDRFRREMVLEYFQEFSAYEELNVNGREFLLVHAGLGSFSPNKELDDYTLDELLWTRPDYGKKYFEDKYLVTGHTPTFAIDEKYRGKIYKKNNHIAVDCGAVYGESLGCICLDTMEEFYV